MVACQVMKKLKGSLLTVEYYTVCDEIYKNLLLSLFC